MLHSMSCCRKRPVSHGSSATDPSNAPSAQSMRYCSVLKLFSLLSPYIPLWTLIEPLKWSLGTPAHSVLQNPNQVCLFAGMCRV